MGTYVSVLAWGFHSCRYRLMYTLDISWWRKMMLEVGLHDRGYLILINPRIARMVSFSSINIIYGHLVHD